MNYADIKTVDIQDGTGIRVSIYVSGCHFHCKGCHNKEAWDFNYGKKFDETTINYIINAMDHEYISGLSILGGEPMELANQQALVGLVKKVKEIYPQKTIWCYTGYKFKEDLLEKMYKEYSYTKELLNNIDIIVDGEFIEEKKLVDLKFRGSTNQKKIDVKASLKTGRIVELKFGDEERYENIEKKQENSKVLIFKEFKIDEKSSLKKKEPVYINVDNRAYFDSQQEPTLTYQIQEMKEKVVAEKARHA
ncbi:MAG TPA: anaerobic ribonucleoside-triphosphate reductase activating protein [Candidatus Scatovivens faecipullorum]|nr:anaerobic ribonucleoside-triphosphate reductase activating protein [Candidatus Scatovivens faecipullorum]